MRGRRRARYHVARARLIKRKTRGCSARHGRRRNVKCVTRRRLWRICHRRPTPHEIVWRSLRQKKSFISLMKRVTRGKKKKKVDRGPHPGHEGKRRGTRCAGRASTLIREIKFSNETHTRPRPDRPAGLRHACSRCNALCFTRKLRDDRIKALFRVPRLFSRISPSEIAFF